MTDGHDDLLHQLADLDPTALDVAPAPGSPRYHSILEHAMTTTTTEPVPEAASATELNPDRRRPRRNRLALAAAAAAVAAIAATAVLVVGPDPKPADAAEALADAAATTGQVTTLRIAATYERPGSTNRLTGVVDGADSSTRSVATYVDGHEEREATVVIGDRVWEDGTSYIAPPEQRNAAYAPSSEAVVKAILDGSILEDQGHDDVRGTAARHIKVTLTERSTAALAALSPSQVAMFELENPSYVVRMDLWIADDYIRRIRVALDYGDQVVGEGPDAETVRDLTTATVEFYDFGADITIAPPD